MLCSEYVPLKQRRGGALASAAPGPKAQDASGPAMPPPPPRPAPTRPQPDKATAGPEPSGRQAQGSLLKANVEAQRGQPVKSSAEKVAEEEKEMMAAMLKKQALRSVQENAIGVVYDRRTSTGWSAPTWCVP